MLGGLIKIAVLIFLFFASATGQAATINVNTTSDEINNDGDCSLREAVRAANTNTPIDACAAGSGTGTGTDTIHLPAGIYTLTIPPADSLKDPLTADLTGDLDIRGSVIIDGAGVRITTIQSCTVSTIKAPCSYQGATGITANIFYVFPSGNLTVSNVTLRHSLRAIVSLGKLNVWTCHVTANGSQGFSGGAIYSGGQDSTLSVRYSLIEGNVGFSGGGISVANGWSADISNTTISGNSAVRGNGGGIDSFIPVVSIVNSTIVNNTAFSGGGLRGTHPVTVRNTIIANNSGGDCLGQIALDPYSSTSGVLVKDNSCGMFGGSDPMLGPLADNGGPTNTHALLSGSPAIDKGNLKVCSSSNAVDQRLQPRVLDGDGNGFAECDIGAYELKRGLGGPGPGSLRVFIDVQFCNSPNEFRCDEGGVLPVTIFGDENFDVNKINTASVRLCLASDPNRCISPIDAAFPVDRGNPFSDLGANQCTNAGGVLQGNPDGFDDIDLLFETRDLEGIAALIGCPVINRTISSGLVIQGELNNGKEFISAPVDDIGVDRIVIVRSKLRDRDGSPSEPK